MEKPQVKLIECPRDAMQGLHDFIPTDVKVRYLDELLKVGFDTIDIGSFVSAKAIPQLADTTEVLARIGTSESKLLVIVANERGAEDACKQERVTYLGYPFSISETFQQRNTNTSIEGSWQRTARIAEMAQASGKELVVYISMAFGNPYGDVECGHRVEVDRPVGQRIGRTHHLVGGHRGRGTARGCGFDVQRIDPRHAPCGVRRTPARAVGQLEGEDRCGLECRVPSFRWGAEGLRRLSDGRG